jgi:hypothetical protein
MLGLEVHVVRQLQVLNEAGALDVVGMVQHELGVLRRAVDGFAEVFGAQGAVHQRHAHRLALAMAEAKAVAAGELRRRRL